MRIISVGFILAVLGCSLAMPEQPQMVKCDATHDCPDGNTCCKLPTGQWGCCPLPNAVCCSDHLHCCPQGTTCDVAQGKCNRQDGLSVPWFTKNNAVTKNVEMVKCDATHDCPDGNTCCKLPTGQWGCCPLPNAVCCSDHLHCCPQGTTCDVAQGKCNRQNGLSVPWFTKEGAVKVEMVKCDATHDCPDGNTCCKLPTGQWGCCPLPNAVCCSDHLHCCPEGTTCDVAQGKCNRQDGLSVPWFTKNAAVNVEMVKCDATHDCPDGNTCCKLPTGQWGCCPLPNAVCCSDHLHCCPQGTTCDVAQGKCNRQDGLSVPWFTKEAAVKVEMVKCDATHDCPDGNTCCKLPTGQWGCCPLPNAVCCSDHLHCCPQGTTCDVAQGKCNRQNGLSVPWFTKEAAVKVEMVKCDATHDCPDGNTCCKLPTGQWGCCPLPNAVCCSDHLHCCPQGTTCDVAQGKCNRQNGLSVPWFTKEAAVKVEMVKCDATHDCPDGNTCCKLPTGQWGCCPLPNAVCCSDHLHCCPQGTTCDVAQGKCNRQDGLSVPWFTKNAAVNVEMVKCDATHDCPDGNTCCKLPTGQWGCCPLPNAVCCSDHLHCCPQGTTCDVAQGKCNRQDGLSVPWFTKNAAVNVEMVKCDATHDCPDGNTCCKLPTGQWGCCPLPNAVCCSDHLHCCPQGTTCDVAQGKCNRQDGLSVPWFTKNAAVNVEMVKCDATHDCPDGNTCCKLPTGQWGCCPLPNAVCCSDHLHCCPQGTTCDVAQGKCNRQDGLSVPWFTKNAAVNVEMVKCDATHDCPDGNTCCKLPTGQWGCCPLPNAVCCSDHLHCCPQGTTCDVAQGKCNRQDGLSVPWFTKNAAVNVEMVKCDATHDCPDGNTCCKLPTGQWGCCPLPNAVCCSDHLHCCPQGTTCDVAQGKCNRQDGISVPWFTKKAAVNKNVEMVKCDATHDCPDGNTCCKLPTGQWGCCPLPNAVCCSDHLHCCPQGTTCDVAQGKCNRQDGLSVPWFTKNAAVNVEMVKCDATHDCPDGNTCCKLPTGQWGCCPLPNAVCCSDHLHCCPQGTTCDVAQGKCNRQDGISVPWFTKKAAVNKNVEMVKCDATHDCPDGNTCCKLPTGQWGCCPLPNAVCCSDHLHCCPQGTTCDVAQGKCNRQDGLSVPWFTKNAAVNVEMVKCDATHDCPDGNTCCKLPTGQWGCCPLPNAVCCSDHLHCCPEGTTCDVAQGKCNRQDGLSLPWFIKKAAVNVKMVKCDATHDCPDGNTCCKLPTGQWGCCPLPNAVCCSDHLHCCPEGTTCDVAQGKCNRQDGLSVPWFTKTHAVTKNVEMVKCDATHDCPDGNTCCTLPTGQWGCCPLPKAVCCSDHLHCCPQGTTCDVAQGKCNRQSSMPISLMTKARSTFKKPHSLKLSSFLRKIKAVPCPDGSECPDSSTCCQMASSAYGCCPMPKAVCCADKVHCCPSGYTCESQTGTCVKGKQRLPFL